MIPWFYDKLRSTLLRKEYSRDLARFWGLMRSQGITELEVTEDHVKVFKGLLLDSGNYEDATISRYLTVIRRTYHYLATHDLVPLGRLACSAALARRRVGERELARRLVKSPI